MHDPGPVSFTAACLTVSDRAAAGVYEDRSGPLLEALIIALGGQVVDRAVVADDIAPITARLRAWLEDPEGPDVLFTTGGTGPAPRDVTPEATAPLLERRFEGVEEALRRAGLPKVPTAVLSRGLVGSTGRRLILNLPGSPGAIQDAGDVLRPLIGHLVSQLAGTHGEGP